MLSGLGGMASGLGTISEAMAAQQNSLNALRNAQLQQQQLPQGFGSSGAVAAYLDQLARQKPQYAPVKGDFDVKPEGNKNMIRDYLNRHKDVVFTLVMAILVDHFVLGGALRHRIKRVIEAALDRIEKALGLPPETIDVGK